MTPREIYQLVLHRSVDLMIEGKAKTSAEAERMAVRELAPTIKKAALASRNQHHPTKSSSTGDARQEFVARLDRMNIEGLRERVAQIEAAKDKPPRKSIPRYVSKKFASVKGPREATPGRPRLQVIEGGASNYGVVKPRRGLPRYETFRDATGRRFLKRTFSEHKK